METAYLETRRLHAGLVGVGLAALFTLLALYLLQWSGSLIIAAGWQSVAVTDAIRWCVAAVAGAVALAVAASCLLGVAHLWRSATSPLPAAASPDAQLRIAPRAAAILIALTLGSPPALADAIVESAPPASNVHALLVTKGIAASDHEPIQEGDTTNAAGSADDVDSAHPDHPHATGVAVPDWRPTRGELPVPSAFTLRAIGLTNRAVRDPAERRVVVRRGDTLWAIAARELGPDASDAQISARWPQWHESNRLTIGPDPDVILPGHILRYPQSTPGCPTNGELP